MKYKVKYFDHISDNDYTLEQANELVEHLNSTFKGCKAHMIVEELEYISKGDADEKRL